MINTNHIIRSGDFETELLSPALRTDKLLKEISNLYLERVKAMNDGNTIAVDLFNHQITNLKNQLTRL